MIGREVAARLIAGILLTGVGFIAGVLIAREPAMETRQTQVMIGQLQQEYASQLWRVRARAERAENELLTVRTSRSELEKSLTRAQAELGYVRDQLAFFEELLPPGPTGAIRLRSVDIDLVDSGLSFRVLLMRSGKSIDRFCGRLEFLATGNQDGAENVTIVLAPGADLDFKQYQRSHGFLALPQGFEPKFVSIRVLNGAIVLDSRRVDL